MTSLDRDDVKKIKKYIEDDNYSKLKKYITRNDISLNEIITKKGEKMLHLAAKEGSSYCMEYLLDSGAMAHLVDKHGNLPLHRALKYVIQNYSRENEKNLVNSLLTFSSKHLDAENVEGVKPRDLILQLERVKARAANEGPHEGRRFVMMEKAPTRAFSWFKAPTSELVFSHLRHY